MEFLEREGRDEGEQEKKKEKRSWRERLSEMTETKKYIIVFALLAIYTLVLLFNYFR